MMVRKLTTAMRKIRMAITSQGLTRPKATEMLLAE